jgi:Tfp pilus assembly protein PilP
MLNPDKMKINHAFIVLAISFLLLFACSKSKWSQADQDKWLKNCKDTFMSDSVKDEDKAQIEELCKCMVKVTSRDYTVKEASDLTAEQMRKILNDCNYSY